MRWIMEPAWGRDFAFAKVEEGDQLLTLYEAEDRYLGHLFGVAYAEAFKSQSPLLVDSPTLFRPALHA